MRTDAEAAASGEKWAYRAAIVIVLWPARVWISLIETPAIASHLLVFVAGQVPELATRAGFDVTLPFFMPSR